MHKRSKEAVIAALKKAEAERLLEQDIYRPIIKVAMDTAATEQHLEKLKVIVQQGVDVFMEGESYPPTDQDWKQLKGYTWEQVPKRRLLDSIQNKDISYFAFMYSEIAEQTQRLKAMAKFFGYIGAVNDEIYAVFSIWRMCATIKSIMDSANPSIGSTN